MRSIRRRAFLWLWERTTPDAETFAPHGIPVQIPRDADPDIRYLLARRRPYEAPEARMVRQHIRPGMNVLELGGCMGVVSATIRSRIGPTAKRVVAEPVPRLAEICRANASIGADPGTTDVVCAAVACTGGTNATFHSSDNAHSGRLARAGETGMRVATVTLDELVARLPEGPFALVCDIEGTELELLERASDALRRTEVLILETHPRRYADPARGLESIRRRIQELGLEEVDADSNVLCFVRPR